MCGLNLEESTQKTQQLKNKSFLANMTQLQTLKRNSLIRQAINGLIESISNRNQESGRWLRKIKRKKLLGNVLKVKLNLRTL